MNQWPALTKSTAKKLVAIAIVVFCSLTLLANENPSVQFSFEKIEKLPLGSSQDEAKFLFGAPSQVYRLKPNGDIIWVYIESAEFQKRTQRMSLTFSGTDLRLNDIYYQPLPLDKVSTLQGLLSHFPNAHLTTIEPSMCGEHYQINKGFDYDRVLGLFITRDKAGNITGLNFTTPISEEQRKTASALTGCPDKSKPRTTAEEITPALK